MLRFLAIAALALLPISTANAFSCPLCGGPGGQTLAGEYNEAALIVVGTLRNWKQNLDDPNKSTTELHVSSIIKDHPYLAGSSRTVLILPRFFPPPDPTSPEDPVLVFAGVYPKVQDTTVAALVSGAILADFPRHTFDPYRGDLLKGKGELASYMKGAFGTKDKPPAERLAFYFEYLDAQELSVGSDAFLEFANAEYADVKLFAEKLPMDKVAAWLVDPNTQPSRFGLYGLLMGHSQTKKAEHAALLRKLLDEPKKFYASGIDGLLGGYILLDPKNGWAYLESLIANVESKFEIRYAALRTLRFFWEYRKDVVGKDKMLATWRLLLAQMDVADMPIDDMRKWKCDDLNADIVAMSGSETVLKEAFVRRSLMKYLLAAAPRQADAAAVVTRFRSKHPDWVKIAEEALEFEKIPDSKIPKGQ